MGLPLIVQSIVYREKNQDFEVLVLKRNAERGGFWNVVNGTLELNESVTQCRSREIREETGIKQVRHWSNEINRFSFVHNGSPLVVIVFAAEVDPSQEVTINEEHTEYRWLSFPEAINLMKFNEDRQGLEICQQKLTEGSLKNNL